MFKERIVTRMADRLGNYAKTTFGNQKYALNTSNDDKKRIKTSKNKINVKIFYMTNLSK